MSTPEGHIVTISLPSWVVTSERMRPQLLAEIGRQFGQGEDDLKKLIRVVGLELPPMPINFHSYEMDALKVYQDLFSSAPVKHTPGSETCYDAAPKPKLVILDFFCTTTLHGIRAISKRVVPVYAWQSGSATAFLYHNGPEKFGGSGDILSKALTLREQIEDKEKRGKEMFKLFFRCEGEITQLPGLPDMYDYELYPQQVVSPMSDEDSTMFQAPVFHFFEDCEGVVMCTSELYEGPAIRSWREWFGKKPVLNVGALSPPASDAEIAKEKEDPVGAEVEAFLDNMLEKHGPHSVIYISFGTFFWPSDPEKLWTVVNELLDQDIPFIMSHASPFAVFPEEIDKRIKASGISFHGKWLPQQVIFRHKALGWFVTHCGQNSVCEALTNGIPLICWPFAADQPINATLLSWVHNVAYELFEVRTGHGIKPIHRLGGKAVKGTTDALKDEIHTVLKAARSYDGDLKRSKAQWFAKQFAAALAEGGEDYENLKKILSVIV